MSALSNGQVLRSIRESKELTLEQLSGMAGYSVKVLENIEKDNHKLMFSEVCNLARAFGMSTNDLGAMLGG